VVWQHDRSDYAKLERFGVYDSLAQCEEVARTHATLARCDRHRPQGCSVATHGVAGRFRIRVLARHRGPARAEDEMNGARDTDARL